MQHQSALSVVGRSLQRSRADGNEWKAGAEEESTKIIAKAGAPRTVKWVRCPRVNCPFRVSSRENFAVKTIVVNAPRDIRLSAHVACL